MNFKVWLVLNDKSVTDAANEIDFSRRHLNGVACGYLKPGGKICRAIFKLTKGEVTQEDLMKNYHEHKKRQEQEVVNGNT